MRIEHDLIGDYELPKSSLWGVHTARAVGKLDQHFVVDAIQGGAGTSTNMNTNEVIANRALELMGKAPGDYKTIHPLNDVNRSQSTNDVYPTALRLALIFEIELLDQSGLSFKMRCQSPLARSFRLLPSPHLRISIDFTS